MQFGRLNLRIIKRVEFIFLFLLVGIFLSGFCSAASSYSDYATTTQIFNPDYAYIISSGLSGNMGSDYYGARGSFDISSMIIKNLSVLLYSDSNSYTVYFNTSNRYYPKVLTTAGDNLGKINQTWGSGGVYSYYANRSSSFLVLLLNTQTVPFNNLFFYLSSGCLSYSNSCSVYLTQLNVTGIRTYDHVSVPFPPNKTLYYASALNVSLPKSMLVNEIRISLISNTDNAVADMVSPTVIYSDGTSKKWLYDANTTVTNLGSGKYLQVIDFLAGATNSESWKDVININLSSTSVYSGAINLTNITVSGAYPDGVPPTICTSCSSGWSSCSGGYNTCTGTKIPSGCVGDIYRVCPTCTSCSVWDNSCIDGKQSCLTKSPDGCTGDIASRSCTSCSSSICTSWNSTCRTSDFKQNCISYSCSPSGCAGTCTAPVDRSCTLSCACGSANGGTFLSTPSTSLLCSVGTASSVTLSGSTYSWTCSQSGYTTASCFATKVSSGLTDTDGDGYLEIHNCTELQMMNQNLNANYELVNNVDCSISRTWNSGAGFIPIGNASAPFYKDFMGNNYTISDLYINGSNLDYVGLFGYTSGSSLVAIMNVRLVNVSITGFSDVGGLVGHVGNRLMILDSSSSGIVRGASKVGGLVGYYDSVSAWMDRVYSTGSVSGSSYVGGLVGYLGNGSAIGNSYSTGAVSGSSYVGGLIGFGGLHSGLAKSYSTGAVSGSSYVGGLVGSAIVLSIQQSYFDNQTSGQSPSFYGEGKPTTEMKIQSTYEEWDFINIWAIDPLVNEGYPYLRWQTVGGITSPVSSFNWSNLNGENIVSAEKGDTVVLQFGNLAGSKSYKIMNSSSVVASGSTLENYTYWKASESGNFTFNVTNDSWSSFNVSGKLMVLNSENNFIPLLVSFIPANNILIAKNDILWFNQSSKDADDLLWIVWDFKDGASFKLENYTYYNKLKNSSLGNVAHNYTSAGNYLVEISVGEMDRGQQLVNYTNVHVLQEGINVIPMISSPENGQVILDSSMIVTFNASQTYVVNCSLNMVNYNFTVSDLKCRYLHAPGVNRNQDLSGYNLLFKWDVGDGTIYENYWNSASYIGVVEFKHRYSAPGKYTASLVVSYSEGA